MRRIGEVFERFWLVCHRRLIICAEEEVERNIWTDES